MIVRIAGTYVHVLELPLLVFLLLAVTVRLARNGFRLKATDVRLPMLLLLSLVLYTCAIALSAWNAVDLGRVAKSALKWAEVVVLVALVFAWVERKKEFALVYWTLALSGTLAVFHVLVLVAVGRLPLLGYRLFPGIEALLALALLLPFLRKSNLLIVVLAAVCVLSTVLSMSRTAWIALPLLLFFDYKRSLLSGALVRSALGGIAVVLIAVYLLDPNLLLYRWTELFSVTHVSNLERWTLLKTALTLFLRHPLTGVGSLNFPRVLQQQGPILAIVAPDPDLLEPHNAFLQVLAEEGFIGFSFFLLSLGACWLLLRAASRGSGLSAPYRVGLEGFFLVMAIYLMFGFISAQFRFFLALGFGLAAATTKVLPGDSSTLSPTKRHEGE
ncbi:MAG: O-antigen ligase family protein [candidate division KSB1 bacterium]|nr:O-antigen ligase family protein [candidate division KSB1 bacterium]